MKNRLILLIVLALVLSFLPSCKKNKAVNNSGGTNPLDGVRVGDTAPNFTEMDTNGSEFSLDSFQGRVILLSFSAMWCGPCRQETPELVQIYNTYNGQGLEIVQCIYEDEDSNPADQGDINRWVQEFGIVFTVVNDPDQSTVNTWRFDAIPFNIIIDRDFIIRYRQAGFYENTIIQMIEQYL